MTLGALLLSLAIPQAPPAPALLQTLPRETAAAREAPAFSVSIDLKLKIPSPWERLSSSTNPPGPRSYFGARYYSGPQGRFTSVDPMNAGANPFDPQSWNGYAYTLNNPLRYVDPDGEAAAEAARWVQQKVNAAADAINSSVVNLGDPGLAFRVTAEVEATRRVVSGFADMFRVGESTGAAWDNKTGVEFGLAVLEDTGRAGGLVLLAVSVVPGPKASPPAGSEYFKPGPFAGEGVPLRGPGRLNAAEQQAVNAQGNALGCHTCGAPTPGTRSGTWVGDHQPVSSLNTTGAAQTGYPHCTTCSATQGGYASQAARQPPPPPPPPRPIPPPVLLKEERQP